MAIHGAVSVFISSTCYDLVDLRAEIGQLLARSGFVTRLSEDANSAFYVDATDDSITSCLNNVEAADVVVCIIDRRYGGVLKSGPLAGLSATHAEVRHARMIAPPKRVFFFIRRSAYQEYEHMRANGWQLKTRWVEPDLGPAPNPNRERWFNFVQEIAGLPRHENWSNWCDHFTSSVDLGPLVEKRLFDAFPSQASVQALEPGRLVRLTFSLVNNHASGTIRGFFQNVGVGPALDLEHGFRKDDAFLARHHSGGVAVGMKLGHSETGVLYQTDNGHEIAQRYIYCKYRNAHGDWFRVETPLRWEGGLPMMPGPERFFVGKQGIPQLEWIQVS